MLSLPDGICIDEAWLARQLGQAVDEFSLEPLGVAQGLVSRTVRLRPKGPGEALPPSLILKIDTDDPVGRDLAQFMQAFRREGGFYLHCGGELARVTPRCFASGDGVGDDSRWLLLEDLSAMRVGNQVRGLSAAAISPVIDAIALMHARFWQAAELQAQGWLPAHDFWFKGTPELLATYHRPFLEDYALRVEPDALVVVEQMIQRSPLIDEAIAHRPWTLVHGDLRAENLLFAQNAEQREVALIDWGTCTRSLAAIDLAFLIGVSMPMPARRGRIPALLKRWHQGLVRHGVRDYSVEQAWSDLQLASLRCLSAVLLLHHWQLNPNVDAQVLLLEDEEIERYCALVVELRALEALPVVPPGS